MANLQHPHCAQAQVSPISILEAPVGKGTEVGTHRLKARNWLIALAVGLVVLAIMLLFVSQPTPPKPVKDGVGPLAVQMAPNLTAPTTHNPLDWWQANHPTVVNSGDVREQDCLYCHDPETSCNNCHSYVGAKAVSSR
jgi:hypothetical protein